MSVQHKKSVLGILFTEEDVLNIHKILGFSCLASFAYRYAHWGAADGNFGPNYGTLVFVVHHFLLHASSFVFPLPEKRIVSGYRLWPEARWHALIFASRSLAFMLLFYYEDTRDNLPEPLHWMNLAIVLSACVVADIVSARQKHQSRTIRDLEFSPLLKWFFSTVQFVATAICVVGSRRYNYHLNFVFVIQVNAFLMTLRRRNLASHSLLVSIYAVLLLGLVALGLMDDHWYASGEIHSAACLGIVAAMLRLNFGVNKYLLWTGVGLVVHWLRGWGPCKTTFGGSW